jgi:hypothetical protein
VSVNSPSTFALAPPGSYILWSTFRWNHSASTYTYPLHAKITTTHSLSYATGVKSNAQSLRCRASRYLLMVGVRL